MINRIRISCLKSMSLFIIAAAGLSFASNSVAAAPAENQKTDAATNKRATPEQLPTPDEARRQAELLHETIHSTLQIVHHRYYREDEGLAIPAFTLKSVFEEVEQRTGVKLHWLVVDAEAMNIGHNPRDEFEKKAVAALTDGKPSYEATIDGIYRHVGPITLGNDCLKCHLSSRSTTADRKAGLVIAIPVKTE